MSESVKVTRLDQTRREIQRLLDELEEWHTKRKDADTHPNGQYRGQYESQLNAIVGEVRGSAEAIEGELKTIERGLDTLQVSNVYEKCARHDRQIVWIWRVWSYFREKFDQRDSPSMGKALRAADEVVWSCYRPFFKQSGRSMDPAPLPYIEGSYSPAAVRRDQAGHLEKTEEDAEAGPLKGYFASLPIPLLQLPPLAVTSPWVLVLIGHEVGHFIQPAIESEFGYVKRFREAVQAAAKEAGGDAADERAWGRWAPEVFADWYCILTMGQWAIWAMGQFELVDAARMVTRRLNYPSPLARLYLMARLAECHGITTGDQILRALGVDAEAIVAGVPQAQKDLAITRQVAQVSRQELPNGLGELGDLLNFWVDDYAMSDGVRPGGEVEQWADALRAASSKADDDALRAARLVVAGAAQAWHQIMQTSAAAARSAAIETVDKAAFGRMIACAEGGKRSAVLRTPQPGKPGERLAGLLLNARNDELFQ